MAGISLEIARKHLSAWLEAELEVTTHQSYTIGSRSLTKADLADIRQQIEFWKNEVARLETSKSAAGETAFSVWSRGTFKTMTQEAKRVEHA